MEVPGSPVVFHRSLRAVSRAVSGNHGSPVAGPWQSHDSPMTSHASSMTMR